MVNPELGASVNEVLTWPLSSWFLFIGLFFILKSLFLPPKWIFLINFVRILLFIWDLVLVLYDIHKEVVLGKILSFGNVLDFQGVNWSQKWTKTFNFGYVPFPLKHLILKDCLETVFVLWETTSGQNFSKTCAIFRGERAQQPPPPSSKRVVSWILASSRKHLNIYNLTATNAKLMKLTMSMQGRI